MDCVQHSFPPGLRHLRLRAAASRLVVRQVGSRHFQQIAAMPLGDKNGVKIRRNHHKQSVMNISSDILPRKKKRKHNCGDKNPHKAVRCVVWSLMQNNSAESRCWFHPEVTGQRTNA